MNDNDKEIARKYLITSLTIKNLELDLRKIQNSTLKVKTGDIQEENTSDVSIYSR